jgi:hypothetical protein
MAVTLSELAELAKSAGLDMTLLPEHQAITGTWGTDRYKDEHGDAKMHVFALLQENGEYITFMAPGLYDLSRCEHRASAIEAMTRVAYVTPFVGYELADDGAEVRATIEYPIENAALSVEQLRDSLGLLLQLVDHYDPVIRHAMKTGTIDLGLADEDPPAERSELEELVAKLGGIEALRKLAADDGAQGAG